MKEVFKKEFPANGPDEGLYGETEQGADWAALRGWVPGTPVEIATFLRDPQLIKDPNKVNIQQEVSERTGFQYFYTLSLWFKPLPFVKIEWLEEWGQSKIPVQKPTLEHWLISYQKKTGSSNIRRLCGSMEYSSTEAKKTLVYLYEELDATHQNGKDLLQGHQGTISTIRDKLKKK